MATDNYRKVRHSIQVFVVYMDGGHEFYEFHPDDMAKAKACFDLKSEDPQTRYVMFQEALQIGYSSRKTRQKQGLRSGLASIDFSTARVSGHRDVRPPRDGGVDSVRDRGRGDQPAQPVDDAGGGNA